MLLAIDIGNTNITWGLFRGKRLVKVWRTPTGKLKIPTFKGKIDKIIVASVVPAVNQKLSRQLRRKFKLTAHFVSAADVKSIKIKLKKKSEIGADRLVDALAAFKLYGGPVIIIDFGTATTFDVVTARGEYLGGAIAPGIALSRDILHERTAKLPKIEIKAPRDIIGNSTIEAMRSGLVIGYVAMVEGMSQLLRHRLKAPQARVLATGGLAPLICKYTTVVDRIDQNLTLKGLQLIGEDDV